MKMIQENNSHYQKPQQNSPAPINRNISACHINSQQLLLINNGKNNYANLLDRQVQNQEQLFDESIWKKAAINNLSSGYLPQEYQVAKEFPKLSSQYHFRIEDDQTILELQRLQYINMINKNKNQSNFKFYDYDTQKDINMRKIQTQKQESSLENKYVLKCSQKFNTKMKDLLQHLDNCQKQNVNKRSNLAIKMEEQEFSSSSHSQKNKIFSQNQQNQMLILDRKRKNKETHGFYTMRDEQYDNQAAINQAYNRIKVELIEQKMQKLSLQQNERNNGFTPIFKSLKGSKSKNIETVQKEQSIKGQKQKQEQTVTKVVKQMKKMTICCSSEINL